MEARLLAHPACLETASALIEKVLAADPRDADAHRLRYLHAWLRHQQGAPAGDVVERLHAQARSFGDVPPLVAPAPELLPVARALAGNGSLQGVDLGLVVAALSARPDAEAPLLDEVDRRLALSSVTEQERRELLEEAILTVTASAHGDERARGRRLAAMMLRCAPHLASGEIVRPLCANVS
jgi:hypothetical protein